MIAEKQADQSASLEIHEATHGWMATPTDKNKDHNKNHYLLLLEHFWDQVSG